MGEFTRVARQPDAPSVALGGTNRVQKGRNGALTGRSFPTMTPGLVETSATKPNVMDAISFFGSNGSKRTILVKALSKKPLTERDAANLLGDRTDVVELLFSINATLRQKGVTAEDAFGREYFAGNSKGPNSFWVVRPNPNVFALPERYPKLKILKPGIHVRLEDLFSAAEVQVIMALAGRNFCTLNELASSGVPSGRIRDIIKQGKINARLRQVADKLTAKLTTAVRTTRTCPTLYYLDADFVKAFGIKFRPKPLLENAFDETDLAIIHLLTRVERMRIKDINRQLSILPVNFTRHVRRINERCGDFRCPGAIVLQGNTQVRTAHLNPDFLSHFGLVRMERKNLGAYFTKSEIGLVEYVLKHPLCTTGEAGAALGSTRANVTLLFNSIIARCHAIEAESENGREIPLAIKVGKHRIRLLFSPEFYRIFGQEYVRPDPVKALSGCVQRRIYAYVLQHPEQKLVDVARHFGLRPTDIAGHKGKINRRLARTGLLLLPRKIGQKGSDNFARLRNSFIAIRVKHGKWDTHTFAKRAGKFRRLRDAAGSFESFAAIVRAVKASVTSEDNERILRADMNRLAAFDFSKFGDQARNVALASKGALERGAEGGRILMILTRRRNAEKALAEINKMKGKGNPGGDDDVATGGSNLGIAVDAAGF